MLWTYNPKRVTVSVHVYPVSGYADGTFVSIEVPDDYTRMDGCDGVITRVQNQIRAGVLRLTLAQSSVSNEKLDLIRAFIRSGFLSTVPVSITDTGGGGLIGGSTRIMCTGAWIRSAPVISFGKEPNAREWVFDMKHMSITVGGSKLTVL